MDVLNKVASSRHRRFRQAFECFSSRLLVWKVFAGRKQRKIVPTFFLTFLRAMAVLNFLFLTALWTSAVNLPYEDDDYSICFTFNLPLLDPLGSLSVRTFSIYKKSFAILFFFSIPCLCASAAKVGSHLLPLLSSPPLVLLLRVPNKSFTRSTRASSQSGPHVSGQRHRCALGSSMIVLDKIAEEIDLKRERIWCVLITLPW